MGRLRICVLCATSRGLAALKCLRGLAPQADFLVVTFPEFHTEPPYVDDIKDFCQENSLEFMVQTNVSQGPAGARIREGVDLLFAISWRYMVPPEVFEKPRLGAYVVHDSLLPKYRGFSPAIWALMNGEKETGVTLFQMVKEVDAGPMVGQEKLDISDQDSVKTLRERGTTAVLALLEKHFQGLAEATCVLTPQVEAEATFTCKWVPDDARIDWNQSSRRIFNLVRATTRPYTGAFCNLGEDKLTIWTCELAKQPVLDYVSRRPGRVIKISASEGVAVLTGDSYLVLKEVSLNGAPPCPAHKVLKTLSSTLH